jgi:hypothetical protein
MAIDQESARATEDPAWHKGLDIRERRSWKTWQLFVAIMLALVGGMAIGNLGSKSASSTGADKPLYSLPPDTGGSSSAQPTTSAYPTTSASTQPTSSGSLKKGPITLLLPNKNGIGPNSTVAFTAGGQWKLGWAYDCQLARNGTGTFAVFVVPSGGLPCSTEVGPVGQRRPDAHQHRRATSSDPDRQRMPLGCEGYGRRLGTSMCATCTMSPL